MPEAKFRKFPRAQRRDALEEIGRDIPRCYDCPFGLELNAVVLCNKESRTTTFVHSEACYECIFRIARMSIEFFREITLYFAN